MNQDSAAPRERRCPRTNVYIGRLWSPAEFAAQCAALVKRPAFSSWAVAMPLPDELVTTLEKLRQETSIGFSMVQTHRGVFYPTVVLQAQSRQVRVMTNLSDGRTPQWLSYVASEGCITLVADVVETQQLVVIDSPCGGLTSAMASELATRSARLDLAARLEDAAGLAQYLTRADALPSALDQFEVDEVHLVLVDAGMSTPSEQSAPFARDPRVIN